MTKDLLEISDWFTNDNCNRVAISHFEEAMRQAEQCIPEEGRAAHEVPKVGVVIVKDGRTIVAAHRNQVGDGDHAEYIALERTGKDHREFIDADLVTTLEPCTEKRHGPSKKSCAEWIVLNRIRKVWIGVLDENLAIRGKSVSYLRRSGIAVGWFPDSAYQKLMNQNAQFFDHARSKQQGPDLERLSATQAQIRDGIEAALVPVRELAKSEMNQMEEGWTTPLLNALIACLNYLYLMDVSNPSEWCSLGNDLLQASDLWRERSEPNSTLLGNPDLSMALSCFKVVESIDSKNVCAALGFARCLIRMDKGPQAERDIIKTTESVSDDDTVSKTDIASAYFELAEFSSDVMRPLFLAAAIDKGGLAIVAFPRRRLKKFLALAEKVAFTSFRLRVKGLDKSFLQIANTLRRLDLDEKTQRRLGIDLDELARAVSSKAKKRT